MKLHLTKLEQFVADNPNLTFEAMAGQLNRTPRAMEAAFDRLEKKRKAAAAGNAPRAMTHTETMETAPRFKHSHRCAVRELIKQIESALTWQDLTSYQADKLTSACNHLELADAELTDYGRSLRADGAGYSIER